jgi:hypothetical protein
MVGELGPESEPTSMASLGAKLMQGLRRAWAVEKTRRRMVITLGSIVGVIVIVVVVSLFASLAGESQSFRDGYSAGGTAYTAYADAKITSVQACRDVEAEPGGRPAHDDPSQWVQGCADAFNLAASDN